MEDPNKELLDVEKVLDNAIDDDKEKIVEAILDGFNSIEPPEEEDGYDAIAHEE